MQGKERTGLLTILYEDCRALLWRKEKVCFLRFMVTWLRARSMRLVVLYRIGHLLRRQGWRLLGGMFDRMMQCRGIDIHTAAIIGPGLRLPHPMTIVIGADVVIGDRAYIMHEVTLGGSAGRKGPDGQSMPHVGNDVFIGAGAKVLGPVNIGHRVWIGANSVVIRDLPDDCVAVGAPARIIRQNGRSLETTQRGEANGSLLQQLMREVDSLKKTLARKEEKIVALSATVIEPKAITAAGDLESAG